MHILYVLLTNYFVVIVIPGKKDVKFCSITYLFNFAVGLTIESIAGEL